MSIKHLGSIPSKPDMLDFISKAGIPSDITIPVKTNNRQHILYVRNQGNFGTCVGFGSAAFKNIQEKIDQNLPVNGFSPLYIYTRCKEIDGIPNVEGTYPRTACNILREGILPENDLPYENLTNIFNLPKITPEMKEKAIPYRIDSYARIYNNDLLSLKQAIYLRGSVMAGLLVTDSFLRPEGGFLPEPSGVIHGGHLVDFVDYDDTLIHTYADGKTYKGFVLCQNSWGEEYGENGFVWIPYAFINWKDELNKYFIYEMWTGIDYINKPSMPEYWRVQLYAFKEKINAQKASVKLKSEGFPIYIFEKDGYYKIQCGAFSIKNNAEKLFNQLKSFGYDPWLIKY
jgi:C1A family cysteine protease